MQVGKTAFNVGGAIVVGLIVYLVTAHQVVPAWSVIALVVAVAVGLAIWGATRQTKRLEDGAE
ncbi:hypothetical protein [Nocardioides zeae]|uniref:Uncharacterized protein n=1 Tax=Nocardioides zeae TaxID=1457234 RepID=A0A6P0HH85_9ACTN|nr:hypothetical protein [Nocardioides zeae]NEN77941.1 hypothetical protein [Nocardioides zeae]